MVELTEHRDGTGTIVFISEAVGYRASGWKQGWSGAWAPAVSANAQFFRIDNPQRVYELVRRQS